MTRAKAIALGLTLLSFTGCKGDEQAPPATTGKADAPTPTPGDTKTDTEPGSTATVEQTNAPIDRMLEYLPADAHRVAYQRLSKDFDYDIVEAVFALPPQAGDLLDDRALLDEGLDIVLDGDAKPEHWLGDASLGFRLPMAKSTYFVRGLSKPAAEVGPLLEQSFTKTSSEGVDVWLPKGSFPWRIVLLEGDVAGFIPTEAVGTGLEALLGAREADPSQVETELGAMVKADPGLELVLLAVGPLVHLDVTAPIAQVNFFLRREGDVYEGQVQLASTGDVQECADQLRARKAPEENQQVQTLIAELGVSVKDNLVLGQLELPPDRLKHLLEL